MNAPRSRRDQLYRGALAGFLGFAVIAFGVSAWLYLKPVPKDPRVAVMPSVTVLRAYDALRSGDLDGFTDAFIPRIREDRRRKGVNARGSMQRGRDTGLPCVDGAE